MSYHGAAGRRHDALPLKGLAEPIADFALAIQPIELVRADDAAELAVAPDPGDDAFIRGKLFERGADETHRIVDGFRRIDPGEPFPQIVAILVDQREYFGGVALLEQLQVDVFAYLGPKHGSFYAIF